MRLTQPAIPRGGVSARSQAHWKGVAASHDHLRSAHWIPSTPAQRALFRVLGTLVGEDRVQEVVAQGLHGARLDDLPLHFDELLELFVPAVVGVLDDPARPWIVRTFVEDIEAEAENDRLRSDPHSSARMAIATRVPDRLPEQGDQGPGAPTLATLHASLEQDVTAPVRRTIVVWNRDRLGRAGVARVLVGGGFDVLVFDEPAELEAHLEAGLPCDAVLADLDDVGSDLALAAVRRHALPLLVWTKATPDAVEARLAREAHVPHAVVSRSLVRPGPLLSALTKLVG